MMPLMFSLATMPGDPARPNEDFAGALGGCAVLLDGSGAPGDLPTGCVHGVPWYVSQLGGRCLAGMVMSEPDTSLADVLMLAIADVKALHRATCELDSPGTPSSMVVMARTGSETMDWLVLGDSALVIEHASGDFEVVTDKRMEQAAPPEYRAVLELPIGTPEHQAARIAFVRRQQPLRNKPGGYPVASTDPGAAHEAITGTVPASDVRRAAMVTDGVTRFAEFGLGAWSDMLGTLASRGPAALFARIRDAEDSDPAGRRWPRAKKHDDVGVVFWENADTANHTPPGLRPVVAAIVTSHEGVLVARRNDAKPPWTFVAGEIEPGERPEDTAVREVKEETGLEVRAGQIIGERDHPATGRHMIYMAAEPVRGTEVFVGDAAELAEVRWVGLAEADELMGGTVYEPVSEHLKRTLRN